MDSEVKQALSNVDRFAYRNRPTDDEFQAQAAAEVAKAFSAEPRIRHTSRCGESAGPGCACTPMERLHADYTALRHCYVFTTRYGDVNPASLASAARSKAALDDLHARIEAAIEIEGGTTGCPVCRAEEGP